MKSADDYRDRRVAELARELRELVTGVDDWSLLGGGAADELRHLQAVLKRE